MRVLTYLMRLGVKLCVGLFFLLRGFIMLEFGLVLLGLYYFEMLSNLRT